jgi:hypothetical protein
MGRGATRHRRPRALPLVLTYAVAHVQPRCGARVDACRDLRLHVLDEAVADGGVAAALDDQDAVHGW